MAAIGTIRKQSGLLIVLIGMAMVLFLLGDFFSQGTNFLTGESQDVGVIGGDAISLQDFEIRVQESIDQQYGAEGANEEARKTLRTRVWQQMIMERTLEPEYNQLGLSVSADELLDNVKNIQPGSILYQYFTDPQSGQVIEQFRDPQTGGLNSARVLQAIQNLINSENARDWLPIENAIKQDVLQSKYISLLSKGLIISGVEADQIFEERQRVVSVSYVVKEYSAIDDSEIDVTEADYQSYFNEHSEEARFAVEEEARTVRIVEFAVNATEEDIEEIRLELDDLREDFANDSNDTAFVAENSETPVEGAIVYVPVDIVDPVIRDSVVNGEVGEVHGPYLSLGRYFLTKLLDTKATPDSVKASHILLTTEEGDTAGIELAKAKLDSIKPVAQRSRNFADLATEFSEDFGSAQKGGDLDWFTKGRMVPEFEAASFDGKVGDMPIVVSQFGVHLIYITEQTEAKMNYLLANVDRTIEPSKSTSDEMYKGASKFSIEHNTMDKFTTAEGVDVKAPSTIIFSDEGLRGYTNSSDIKRWIFEASAGDISSPFENGNRFLVLALEDISEKGKMTLESAKGLIEQDVMNALKAERILSELADVTSLDDAASKFESQLQKIETLSFADGAMSGGLGRETEFIGTIFSTESGFISKPVVGNRGVFVARVDNIIDAPAERDLTTVKREESANMSSRVNGQFFKALQDEYGVEDNRARFY